MFYNDPYELTQLPPSSSVGLVLPTGLQNLPALLAREALLISSIQLVLVVYLFLIHCCLVE